MPPRLLGCASAPVVIGLEKPVRAMEIIEPGGPEVVRFAQRDEPAPGPGQVTIRVRYAGLNFVDVLARRGVPGSRGKTVVRL